MSEATMTAPGSQPTARFAPVGHTDARHVALATVDGGSVSYDREHATWSLHTRGRSDRAVRGAEQRTLRDLLDFGLVEYREASGPAKVRLTSRGRAALTLWGDMDRRLQGADE